MRIALTESRLVLPPTYFTLSHAERLKAEHEFSMFTMIARIDDPRVSVPVQQSVPHERWPFSRMSFRQRELLMPAFMPRLTRQIVRYTPDVIHLHFATWSLAAVKAARSSGTPLITTVHGADVAAALRTPHTAMERWHQRNVAAARTASTRVLAVSEYLAGRAVRAGFDPSRLEVHYLGVDADYFTPAAPGAEAHSCADSELPLVLFVGALSVLKGARDLVRASVGLVDTVPHRLVLVGEGPLEKELRSSTEDQPHVSFTGSIDREAVRELMRTATVFVLPTQETRGQRESAGLVLLEAQACGTPVVAYDSGGTTEMFRKDVTGVAVPEKDTAALQFAIGQVLAMPTTEYIAMRTAAREFVLTERSLALSCTQLVDHYRDVLG
ncbi:glycosyltransferase [Homoserinimonas sp. OAct 916]|uniref:glycosyltransferase n=1 Tax=Homoserinimonas sp. OAct 916 TaxID=2211450 RepID=UPI000DBE2F37|nr:glycosyltransferase [Homoserinimonas sp. OAct 916]